MVCCPLVIRFQMRFFRGNTCEEPFSHEATEKKWLSGNVKLAPYLFIATFLIEIVKSENPFC